MVADVSYILTFCIEKAKIILRMWSVCLFSKIKLGDVAFRKRLLHNLLQQKDLHPKFLMQASFFAVLLMPHRQKAPSVNLTWKQKMMWNSSGLENVIQMKPCLREPHVFCSFHVTILKWNNSFVSQPTLLQYLTLKFVFKLWWIWDQINALRYCM